MTLIPVCPDCLTEHYMDLDETDVDSEQTECYFCGRKGVWLLFQEIKEEPINLDMNLVVE